MELQITTLIENRKGEHLGLMCEHGISFFINFRGRKILFDAGQSDGFIHNARQLQIPLRDIEHVVLSHGHYDHTGGFPALCEITTAFQLWVGKGFFDHKYAQRGAGIEFLGNNFDAALPSRMSIPLHVVNDDVVEIIPGLYVVGNFPRTVSEEKINPRFVVRRDGELIPDPFTDEVLIAIESSRGMVVLLGCSHPGMRNMLNAVSERFGKPIHAVLGGTHLVEAEGESLSRSVELLVSDRIAYVGVSHCTGKEVMEELDSKNERFFRNATGMSFEL